MSDRHRRILAVACVFVVVVLVALDIASAQPTATTPAVVSGWPTELPLPAGWPGYLVAMISLLWGRYGQRAAAGFEALVTSSQQMAATQQSLAKVAEQQATTSDRLVTVAEELLRSARVLDDTAQRLEREIATLQRDRPQAGEDRAA